ncbi:ParB/RepB/Spo0J family partition protein [Rhodobacterales bacterium]|nr:ParB/RepB/Spo0J family partition protein [Rhodobacterales bacterium]
MKRANSVSFRETGAEPMTKTDTNRLEISFSKLALDPMNVRKTYTQAGITELAESIASIGVLQNLVVRDGEKKGHYLVTAGGRRFRALEHLIANKRVPASVKVTCVLSDEKDATEISLAENIMREGMTPADEFRAFKQMADEGKTVSEIATRFGASELVVTKRLKLARVSPVLFELFETGDMDLSQLQAFTVTDDHEAQERVWNSLPTYYRNGRDIRKALTDGKIPASDKRIKFLGGLDAVREAGCTVVCDLFNTDGGYAEDAALIDKMVADKIDARTLEVASEGWKWCRYQAELDYMEMQKFGRVYATPRDLTDEEQKQLEALEDAVETTRDTYEETGEENDRIAYEAAEATLEDFHTAWQPEYSDEQKAQAGAILTLGYNGELRIERGLIDPQDVKAAAKACSDTAPEEKTTSDHSKALVADLTARKTAALRLELAKNPDLALAVSVHSMAIKTLYEHRAAWTHGAVEISLDSACLETHIKDAGECGDLDAIERVRESWKSVLPADPADLWDWCTGVSQAELLRLQAFLVAQTINAVSPGDGFNGAGVDHGNRIGAALGLDMADHFQPTAEAYFSRIKLNAIHASVVEVRGAEVAAPILKMKKKEAAAYAADKVADSRWVPDVMKFVSDDAETESDPSETEIEAAA